MTPIALPVGTAVLLVMVDVDPDFEDDLNRWMEEEHIPQRLAFPGFLSARRFRIEDVEWPGTRHLEVAAGRRYLTIYELETLDAVRTPEYLGSYDQLTEWSQRVSPHQRDVIRSVYSTTHVAVPPAT